MGVMNNKIEIDKLRKGSGGAGLEERLSHLEDEVTKVLSISEDDTIIGEWHDGRNIHRSIYKLTQDITFNTTQWTPFITIENIDNVLDLQVVPSLDAYGQKIYTPFRVRTTNSNNVDGSSITGTASVSNGTEFVITYLLKEE